MRDRDLISDQPVDRSRFWCVYTDLEEYKAGMWSLVGSEDAKVRLIVEAVALLRSPEFSDAIARVMNEWPVSCRAEFTSPGNHIAWIGQAACCLARGVPEDLTRRAWWKLTDKQRAGANRIAGNALASWEGSIKVRQLELFQC